MWTYKNRDRYNRDGLRYPSDLTDEEWNILRLLIFSAKHGGRPRKVHEREIINGCFIYSALVLEKKTFLPVSPT